MACGCNKGRRALRRPSVAPNKPSVQGQIKASGITNVTSLKARQAKIRNGQSQVAAIQAQSLNKKTSLTGIHKSPLTLTKERRALERKRRLAIAKRLGR